MKKYLFAMAITACIFNQVYSQDKGYVLGNIVSLKKDTVKGCIMWVNELDRQNKIVFYDLKDKKHIRKGYLPGICKGYILDGNFYEPIKYSDEKNREDNNFAMRTTKGQITVYKWYVLNPHGKKRWPDHPESKIAPEELATEDLIRKGTGEVENMNTISWVRFDKAMADYVKEDKELAEKITKLEYKREDLQKIVDEYNEWYRTKKQRKPQPQK